MAKRISTAKKKDRYKVDLKEVKVKCMGLFPLLTHNPASMGVSDNGPKNKKIYTPSEDAKSGCYMDDKENYCLPSVAFRNAFLTGLKGKKIGKVGAATRLQPAVFNVDDLTVILDAETLKPIKKYDIDARRVLIGRAGIIRHRPKFHKWAAIVTFRIDQDIMSIEQLVENLNEAGKSVGVGDFRIEKRGQFGSFDAFLYEDKK